MRSRMALYVAGIQCELREVALKNKPLEMLNISPKGTVPVLLLPDGRVIDESLNVMLWALNESDPLQWLKPADSSVEEMLELIEMNDGQFKFHLDRYKYPDRYGLRNSIDHFKQASSFLSALERSLENNIFLFGSAPSLADVALFPFVRQFAAVDRQAFESLALHGLNRWLDHWITDQTFQAIMLKHQPWTPEGGPVYLIPSTDMGI
ncbi:glutathionine S-transferase [Mariprofundus micogutta]|uniref:Glutathionine S-transferase n=2 Tax=Mariprofundus micogutta TaxID=1921010 RepID=A0A1L8CQJ9_9PROT|nr:glutathionine S-transferase [Mariprofundus micogutta]